MIKTKARREATGKNRKFWTNQPHSFRVRQVKRPAYTLCPDNGGNSGIGYYLMGSPCSSEAHSASACGPALTFPDSLYRRFGAYSSSSQPLQLYNCWRKLYSTCCNVSRFFRQKQKTPAYLTTGSRRNANSTTGTQVSDPTSASRYPFRGRPASIFRSPRPRGAPRPAPGR